MTTNVKELKLTVTRGARAEYRDELTGEEYFSVSQHLTVLDPEAFAGVDPIVLASAGMRGEKVHLLFALMLLSLGGHTTWPERPRGVIGEHYDSLSLWIDKHKPKVVLAETKSLFRKLGYAGTPDCLVWIGNDLWLIDLKTGIPREVHAVQLHAYKRMEGYEKAKRLGSLYSRRGKIAQLVEHTHNHTDWGGFMAANAVLHWRRMRLT